jgi:ABC-type molybdate transport system substrate-binding protein
VPKALTTGPALVSEPTALRPFPAPNRLQIVVAANADRVGTATSAARSSPRPSGSSPGGKAAAAELPGLRVLDLPEEFAVCADHGLTVLAGSPQQEAAAGWFAMFTVSPEGQAILARWGFAPVAAPAS